MKIPLVGGTNMLGVLEADLLQKLRDKVPDFALEAAEGLTLRRLVQLYVAHDILSDRHAAAKKALKEALVPYLSQSAQDNGASPVGTVHFHVESLPGKDDPEYDITRVAAKKVEYDGEKLIELYGTFAEVQAAFKAELKPVEKAVKALTGEVAEKVQAIRTESVGSISIEVTPTMGPNDPVVLSLQGMDHGADAL